MKYTKLVSIRIDPNKFDKLNKLAQEKETSVGSIIRQAVSKYLLENSH